MEIQRDTYLQKLILRKHNGMIKVITGIRRSGKSYLLFTIFKNHLLMSGVDPSHIIELNFDSFENEKYRDPTEAYSYLKGRIVDHQMYYFLLDEIQLLNKFESILNSFLRLPNVDIYVTGSNAKFLSKDVITEFRGRGDQVHVSPLSFSEFYSIHLGDKNSALRDYMYYGGLPQIAMMTTHEQKQSYLNNLFLETYISDILNRNHMKNDAELEEILDILSSSIGSLTNPNKLSHTFQSVKQVRISAPTIKKYIDYLMDSFLIDRALRYDIKGKKYIDTPSKYYFTDLGLRNSRLNFRQMEETHSLENIIYNELKLRGYSVDVGIVTISEKDESGKLIRKQLEVDFVCNKADVRYYIQSALSIPDKEKLYQEQRPFLSIPDSFRKIIITKDNIITHYNEDGVLMMNIFDFLLNPSLLNS